MQHPDSSEPDWNTVIENAIHRRLTIAQFSALFGVSLNVLNTLWFLVSSKHHGKFKKIHLLYTLYFLRLYPSAQVASAFWQINPEYFNRICWNMIFTLEDSLDFCKFENRTLDRPWIFGDVFVYAVIDGKFCPIQCDRSHWDLQQLYYSGKHKRHGLKYEIAVHWRTGRIVWLGGGVFGAIHDLTLCRSSGILDCLLANEGLFGDKGYVGELRLLCPFRGRSENLTLSELQWNEFINKYRVIVENALGRICKFKIVTDDFRSGNNLNERVKLHRTVFYVVSNIAHLDILQNPLRADDFESADQFADPLSDDED
jgi:hypothetical protein